MDRSVKEKNEWLALLPRIQSHSKELESGLARSSANLIEALAELDSLEELTQANLAPPPSFAAALPPPEKIQAQTPAAFPDSKTAPKPEYKTHKQEYAPALNKQDLVQALLDYQKRQGVRPPRGVSAHAQASAGGPSAASPASPSEFAYVRVPEVQAEPKASALRGQRMPGVRIPVLRPKPGGSS